MRFSRSFMLILFFLAIGVLVLFRIADGAEEKAKVVEATEKGVLYYEFLGNTVLQYISFFGVILLSLIAMRISDWLVGKRFRGYFERRESTIGATICESAKRPAKLIILIIALQIGAKIFTFPEPAKEIVEKIFSVLIIATVAYALVKMLDIIEAYVAPKIMATKTKLDDQIMQLIKKTLRIFIIAIAAVMMIQSLGYNVTAIITGLGIGGLAIALAAQDTLSNLFGSIALFADRPFQVGDRVIVEGNDGPIESIGLRSTRIRTLDGTLVTVPNKKMADAIINNISKRPTIKNLYTITLTYNTSYEKMRKALEILRDILGDHPSTDNYWVYWKDFGSHSLDILVIHWCKYTKYQEFLIATEEINLEIKRRFEDEGIEFAFPTQTVYLKQEEGEEKEKIKK